MSVPSLPTAIHERSQFFYTALTVFLSRQNNGIMPEALYFMEPDQLLTFVQTFGGTTVRVPTMKEFGEDLLVSLALFHHHTRGLTWQAVQDKMDIPDGKWKVIMTKAEKWHAFMKDELQMDPAQLVK